MLRAGLFGSTAAFALIVAGDVQAQSGYAGTYQASPATMIAEVTTWGADCGMKPQSQTLPEPGNVEVRDQGAHLQVRFPTRVVRTNACWSQNPAVKLINATPSGQQWNITCTTPDGDPKREIGHYTLVATSPFTLELREESEYLWQLKESRCVATVRITQRLERPSDGKAATPHPPAAPIAAPVAPCVPGAITRLRLRPSESAIQPGQRVCFSARGFDALGCSTDVDIKEVTWSLEKATNTRATLTGGCFKASDSTADAEGTFKVIGTQGSLRAESTVAVAVPDLSDIIAHRDGTAPNLLQGEEEARGAGLADAGVKAVAVASDDKLAWLLGLVGLTGSLGLGAWLLVSRRRVVPTSGRHERSSPLPRKGSPATQAAPVERVASSPVTAPAPEAALRPAPVRAAAAEALAPAPPPASEPMICPQCRRGFTPGTTVCATDGTRLVAYATFVREAKAEARPLACASCGHPLAADAAFCGVCGKRI